MRVLYFHQHFLLPSQGAGGTRSYEMAKSLVARGHSVLVVCGAAEGGLLPVPEVKPGVRRGTIEGVEVIQFCLRYSNYDSFSRRMLIFARFALSSVGVSLREKHDLLFASSTPLTAAVPGIIGKYFRRRPFVFEVRDPWPDVPYAMGILKNPLLLKAAAFLERLAYRQADANIGLSPGIRDIIHDRSPPGKPLLMVPNGCDLSYFQPAGTAAPGAFGLPENVRFLALYAGAHGLANGLGAVLDAASVLKARGRRDLAIVLVGDGKEKPELVRRAKEQQLDNCRFLDAMPKERLAELMPKASAGLMIFADLPVFYRGTSPNKFFDYIACGLPVIINYPGWLQEEIEAYRCGFAVAPGDPERLADALVSLADDPERQKMMGKRARGLAEERFDRKQLADQFVQLLEEVEKGYER